MDARHFLILEQNTNHLAEAEIRSERELADTIAVFVRVAVVPEVALEIGAIALGRRQPAVSNLENQRRPAKAAVFRIEIVARRSVADKRPVNRSRGREYLARRKIGPVARIDEAAGLHPGQRMIECGPEIRAIRGPDGQRPRMVHPVAQLRAQSIDKPVIRAHALTHDLRRDANHVRVPDAPPFDDADNGHAGRQLAFLRLDAQDAGVRELERAQNFGWRRDDRTWGNRLNQEATGVRTGID